jgi:hypothetical protein
MKFMFVFLALVMAAPACADEGHHYKAQQFFGEGYDFAL